MITVTIIVIIVKSIMKGTFGEEKTKKIGKNISSGININVPNLGNVAPTLFKLDNKDPDHIIKLIQAYCNQLDVFITDNAEYKVELLGQSELNDNLRGILFNGYPTKTIDELKALEGLSGLTDKQAIAATQLAIWNLTRGETNKLTSGNDNVNKLYKILRLKKETVITPDSSINVSTP